MSVGTYVPPEITVAFDPEEGFVLMATNHGRSAMAGIRLFRAEPWPAIKFRHTEEEPAMRDAATLRNYLDECATGRRKDKEEEPRARGWWED